MTVNHIHPSAEVMAVAFSEVTSDGDAKWIGFHSPIVRLDRDLGRLLVELEDGTIYLITTPANENAK